jgi:hypothetical protein
LPSGSVVSIVESVILEGSVESRTIIASQWQALLQSVDQIRVGNEVSSVQEAIILARLYNAPGILVIPASSGEKRGRPENPAESVEGDIQEPPAVEELILLLRTEDLFETLVK